LFLDTVLLHACTFLESGLPFSEMSSGIRYGFETAVDLTPSSSARDVPIRTATRSLLLPSNRPSAYVKFRDAMTQPVPHSAKFSLG
jgi:hypothetical protein